MITINMDKAREIHKGRIRDARVPIFAELDKQFMIALEKGDTKTAAEVGKKKQALRDATEDPCILNAETPEELAAAIPTALQ